MEVNSLGPVSGGSPIRPTTPPIAASPPGAPAVSADRPVAPTDELELSSVNSTSNSVDLNSEFRSQRLARIQQQIADGTYETAQKLDVAVDRMLDRLLGE
jgi:negative regulator of flagellin synthesis FlgM